MIVSDFLDLSTYEPDDDDDDDDDAANSDDSSSGLTDHWLFLVIGSVVLLVLIVIGITWYSYSRKRSGGYEQGNVEDPSDVDTEVEAEDVAPADVEAEPLHQE